MERDRYCRIEALFHAAVARPVQARSAFVASACGDDPGVVSEVMALLAADDSGGNVLDTPACEAVLGVSAVRSFANGQRVGRYEIVRLVGSGGMGNVYEAIQDRPHRSVALKILRTALASDAERRRFTAEAELLGRLRHPNIASIYDAGLHTEGPLDVPYFAMEYIGGATNLVQYTRAQELSVSQRLRLFVKVCEAVQHGHQKGVVHRDLKPGNILVDSTGEPKIIDYGVACALDGGLALTSMRTSVDAFIGTLQYMSPEQLASGNNEVDTRSDVYALGLVLFEILAEKRPREFGGTTLSDAIRAIETLPSPTLGSMRRDFRGDLSTIVAKAMEKKPARRYASSSGLAVDIQRFLRKEPILARPPSASYRLARFASRNKPLAVSLALAVMAIVSGLGVATWQFRNAMIQSDRAHIEARKAQRVSTFLQNVLASADPRSSTATVTIREALDRAASRLDAELSDEPRVYADVQSTVGGIYERMGDHARAERHMRAALQVRRELFGPRSCQVASTLSDLSWSVGGRDPDEQERLLREALGIYRQRYGDGHYLAVVHKSYLAGCLADQGEHKTAEKLVREALGQLLAMPGAPDDNAAYAAKVLAQTLQGLGRTAEAEAAYRNALDLHRRVYPSDHYELGLMLSCFAKFLSEENKPDEAVALKAEAEGIKRMRVGGDGLWGGPP